MSTTSVHVRQFADSQSGFEPRISSEPCSQNQPKRRLHAVKPVKLIASIASLTQFPVIWVINDAFVNGQPRPRPRGFVNSSIHPTYAYIVFSSNGITNYVHSVICCTSPHSRADFYRNSNYRTFEITPPLIWLRRNQYTSLEATAWSGQSL